MPPDHEDTPDAPGAALQRFRSRNKQDLIVRASSIRVNPRNWRAHPDYQQSAMTKVLERIGFVGKLLVYEPDPAGAPGQYELIDGELRRGIMGDDLVEVTVCDLTPAEAMEVLAVYDQIAALATSNQSRLSSLIGDLRRDSVPLEEMGWPDWKLNEVLQPGFVPPASNSADEIAEMAAGGGGDDGDGDPAEPESEYRPFAVPLTTAQEGLVRQAVADARAMYGLGSSGEALVRIAEEWRKAAKSSNPKG